MIRRLHLIFAAILVFSISGQGARSADVQEITSLHLAASLSCLDSAQSVGFPLE